MLKNDQKALLKQAQAGDVRAMESVLEPHRPLVRNYLSKRVRSQEDCEDLVQEVFVSAVRALASFRNECPLGSWLLCIAANQLTKYYKKLEYQNRTDSLDANDNSQKVHENEVIPSLNFMEEVGDRVMVEQWLEAARRICTAVEFRVIWLYYRYETMEEVAGLLDIPASTASSHFRRGRAKLLAYLFEHQPEALGGREAIRQAIEQLQSSPHSSDRLNQKEMRAIDNPRRSSKVFRSACLKIAKHLQLPFD